MKKYFDIDSKMFRLIAFILGMSILGIGVDAESAAISITGLGVSLAILGVCISDM